MTDHTDFMDKLIKLNDFLNELETDSYNKGGLASILDIMACESERIHAVIPYGEDPLIFSTSSDDVASMDEVSKFLDDNNSVLVRSYEEPLRYATAQDRVNFMKKLIDSRNDERKRQFIDALVAYKKSHPEVK